MQFNSSMHADTACTVSNSAVFQSSYKLLLESECMTCTEHDANSDKQDAVGHKATDNSLRAYTD